MARLGFFVIALAALASAHSPPTFPGTNNVNQPPQAHHQAQAAAGHQQQQVPPAHPNSPPTQQFGGEAVKDSEHIKEHLEGKVDPTANMTPEQMQFHYFNMHDLDKNGRLDGVELIKAITHFHQENPNPNRPDAHQPPPLPTELELEQMIDSILKEDDFNSDGFIDYGEFIRAQKQREEAARAHAAQQPPRQ